MPLHIVFLLALSSLAYVNGLVVTYVQVKDNVTIPEEHEVALVHAWFIDAFYATGSIDTPSLYKAYDGMQPNWVVLSDSNPASTPHTKLSVELEKYDVVSTLSSRDLPFVTIKWLNLVQTILKPIPGAGVEFEQWYAEEHTPLLSKIKGWVRGGNYHLASEKGKRRRYLGVQELSSETTIEEVAASPEFEAAMNTTWRAEIMKSWEQSIPRIFEVERV
ncbi:hypothetical protein VNI00_015589 [Paramarasmius palmivorus]|uniref:EthD domain-containing protein n=1 Tax=Paramarasmius palmivorus TaxID=297713 RepID=A0AAW0BJ28_9AGAR